MHIVTLKKSQAEQLTSWFCSNQGFLSGKSIRRKRWRSLRFMQAKLHHSAQMLRVDWGMLSVCEKVILSSAQPGAAGSSLSWSLLPRGLNTSPAAPFTWPSLGLLLQLPPTASRTDSAAQIYPQEAQQHPMQVLLWCVADIFFFFSPNVVLGSWNKSTLLSQEVRKSMHQCEGEKFWERSVIWLYSSSPCHTTIQQPAQFIKILYTISKYWLWCAIVFTFTHFL